ncbi:MAG TPA: BamA/TamA family outer membrane protein [Candidatus Eisenbacteria bacterium]|nr:BamA/TamA family outer membrane protein [Candidatus Eisenbacteria bacterium]
MKSIVGSWRERESIEAIIDSQTPPANARWSPNATKEYPASGPAASDVNFDSSVGCASGATGCRELRGHENEDAAIDAMANARRSPSAAMRGSALRLAARRRASFGVAILILGSFLAGARARAQTVESYWGPIAAEPDTVAVALAEPPKPVWEHVLLAPYRVVTFPIVLVSKGTGASLTYMDEHRVIERAATLLGPRKGPFGFLLDFRFGGLSGFGGGLIAEHTKFLGEGNTLRVRGSTTTNHDDRAGVAARFRSDRGGFVEFGAGYRQRPNVRYFGLGPKSREEDESYLHQEAGWIGLDVRRPFGGESHLELNLDYTTVATGAPGSDNDPPAEDYFPPSSLPGYGRHSYGVTFGGQWMHESPGLQNRPGRGGLQRVRASYFQSVDRDQVRFWTYRGEVQHFITLWRPLRVLALRGVGSWIGNVGSDPVPLARLNTNDDPDLLRGYDDFRWRDRGIVITTAEYRWPVWAHQRPYGPGIDAYLLTDGGQVFDDARQIALREMKLSYGGGLRIESGRGFVFRIEYARSEETSIIRLRADQVFQFVKGGFLYGREPVPAR